jgi:hypothetical protein
VIHAQTILIGGFASDLYLVKTVIDMYVICGLLDYGRKVFDEMAERAAHLVIFKHRWRWNLSCWRPLWVPLMGGRGLRHLSRMKMTFGSPNVSRDAWVNETAGSCFTQSGHRGKEDDDRCQRRGHGCRSFLHGGAWLELLEGSRLIVFAHGSLTVLEVHMAAFWKLEQEHFLYSRTAGNSLGIGMSWVL